MYGSGKVILERQVDCNGLSGGEVDDFSCDGYQPGFIRSGSCDVGEVFFGVKVLVFSCGEAFEEKDAKVGDPGVGLVFRYLES